MNLLQNAIYIPAEDLYVVSAHQHDYVSHRFPDGHGISVDGGTAYLKRDSTDFLATEGRYEEWWLKDDDPFERIADRLLWGTYGKDGTEPLTYRPIKELAHRPDGLAHMRAILDTQLHISPWTRRVIEYWIAQITGQPS